MNYLLGGIPMTLTYGLNALPETLRNHYTDLAHIVEPLTISLIDAHFAPHIQTYEQETDHLLDNHPTQLHLKNAHPFAKITTRQAATADTATIVCPQCDSCAGDHLVRSCSFCGWCRPK